MAKSTIKLRIKEEEIKEKIINPETQKMEDTGKKIKTGNIIVKALMTHPMDTGLIRDKKTGKKIPAYYITEVLVEANGEPVMTANWSGAISKNPFISFKYAGSKSDVVKLSWKDNQGNSDSLEKKVGKK